MKAVQKNGRGILNVSRSLLWIIGRLPLRLRYAAFWWLFSRVIAFNYGAPAHAQVADIFARTLKLPDADAARLSDAYFRNLIAGYACSSALALEPQGRSTAPLLSMSSDEALPRDKPLLFFITHMSGYQVPSVYLAREFAASTSLSLREANESLRAGIILGGRNMIDILTDRGVTLINLPSFRAIKDADDAFARGTPVISFIDANAAAPDSPVTSNFLGYRCPVQTGLIGLARRRGAAIVLGEMSLQEHAWPFRHKFTLRLQRQRGLEQDADIKPEVDRIFEELGQRIVADPPRWTLWRYYDQFKSAPG